MKTIYALRIYTIGLLFLSVSIFNTVNAQCTVSAGNDTTVYNGYSPLSCVPLTATSTGTAPFSYLWSTGDTNASITACDTATATYVVSVTDSNGCVAADTVTVFVVDVHCGNNNNKVLVCHIPPGNPANAHAICVSENAVAAHLAHGDVLGACPVPTCSVSLGNDTTTCAGNTILLEVDTHYVSVLWSDSSTAFDLSVTAAGAWWVEVTDTNGCVASDTIDIMFNPTPIVNAGADTVLINGGCITLWGSATGGTLPYTYLWSTGDSTDSAYVCDTVTAMYVLVVTDSNGCSSSDSVMVFVPDTCMISLGNDTTVCDGTVDVLDAGSGYYAYLWSDSSTASTLTPTASGDYSVTVTDSTGCMTSDTVNVTLLSNPIANAGMDTVLLAGTCDTLNGMASGGVSPYSYLWYTGAMGTIDTTASIVVCDSVTTSYIFEVTDSNGCSATDTVTVFVLPILPPPAIQCDSSKVLVCHIPPGNPGNPQTICVSMSALAAHLAHGDVLGQCSNMQQNNSSGSLLISPNPSSYQTQLQFITHQSNHTRVEILNLNGEVVAVIFDGEAEEYSPYLIQFNSSELPGGVYVARIMVGNLKPVIQKMIILN